MKRSDSQLVDALRRIEASVPWYCSGEAQDLVQDAMVRALTNGVRCDAEPWLRVVTKRLAIDHVRRRREVASGASEDLERYSTAGSSTPEDAVLRSETREAVRNALDTLPPRYRDALLAYLDEDESPSAVARRLGLTPNATWTLLSRARDRLRAELQRTGFAPALFGWVHRWRESLATTGVAASVAIAVAVGGPATAPQAPESRDISSLAIAAQPVTLATVEAEIAPAPARSHSSAPKAAVDADVAADIPGVPEIRHRQRAEACVPGQDNSLVYVDRWTQDNGRPSVLADVLDEVPEPLQENEASTCGGES